MAACGNAGGMELPATVAPFILRAVKLIGVNSVRCPRPRRLEAWRRLSEVPEAAERQLAGAVRGRLVPLTRTPRGYETTFRVNVRWVTPLGEETASTS